MPDKWEYMRTGPVTVERMNDLGKIGWELCGVEPGGKSVYTVGSSGFTTNDRFIYKRKLNDT